jgi:membrane associated rhomboid family serine protease
MNQPREPALRGPWPAWAIAGLILLSYGVQSYLMPDVQTAADRFGFVSSDLARERWLTMFSALFIHGGWIHAGMNALGALAFGAPVARLLGTRGLGPAGLLLFFLVCGVLGNLGYAALNPHSLAAVVGASGAVSGLFGAASRLVEHRPGLSPLASRTVVGSAAAWVVANVVLGSIGYAPGLGAVQVAWQVHIVGYAAGLLLIRPWARLLAPREPLQS